MIEQKVSNTILRTLNVTISIFTFSMHLRRHKRLKVTNAPWIAGSISKKMVHKTFLKKIVKQSQNNSIKHLKDRIMK